ncbi:MAG: D-alanine--D-alanine ligase [Patescibacteria group bacterium]
MNVLVLGGGNSPEREVSLRSARAVANAARRAGFDVSEYDPANGFSYFDKSPKDIVVLPILHGINGEDGVVQAALEERGLPFLGADSSSSAACFDKWLTLQAFKEYGVPTAESQLVKREDFDKSKISKKPYVLKVVHGGSSIGVLIARDPSKITQEQIDEIFNLESRAVLEELVEGTEITVPILDGAALPVIEIVPPVGGEFDYDNKYNGKTAEICPPKSVSEPVQKEAQRLAEKAHQIRNCRHLSRTDLMVRPDGSLVVFDINTIPGLTNQSLFPKSAAVAGITMPQLAKRFVKMIVRDYNL